jgi:phage shock protein PspC (stress-responsive transcriptional regulator)
MTPPTAPAAPRDNLLGICHALGETFGFNPIFLRIALLVGVMLNAETALAVYGVAGAAVLIAKFATRKITRQRTRAFMNA